MKLRNDYPDNWSKIAREILKKIFFLLIFIFFISFANAERISVHKLGKDYKVYYDEWGNVIGRVWRLGPDYTIYEFEEDIDFFIDEEGEIIIFGEGDYQ